MVCTLHSIQTTRSLVNLQDVFLVISSTHDFKPVLCFSAAGHYDSTGPIWTPPPIWTPLKTHNGLEIPYRSIR